MDKQDLKACPCCGGKANYQSHRIGKYSMVAFVHCLKCGLSTEQFEETCAPMEQAITAWNTRASDTEIAALKAEIERLEERLRNSMPLAGNHPWQPGGGSLRGGNARTTLETPSQQGDGE